MAVSLVEAEAGPLLAIRRPVVPAVVFAVAAPRTVHRSVAPAVALPVADWERAAASVGRPVSGWEQAAGSMAEPADRRSHCPVAQMWMMLAVVGSQAAVRVQRSHRHRSVPGVGPYRSAVTAPQVSVPGVRLARALIRALIRALVVQVPGSTNPGRTPVAVETALTHRRCQHGQNPSRPRSRHLPVVRARGRLRD